MPDHSNHKRRRLENEIEQGEADPAEDMMIQYYLPSSQVQRQAIRRRIYELERNETIRSYITDSLVLTRPLVAFDLETTGLYPQGGSAPYIISMSFIKVFPGPSHKIHVFKSGNLRDWDGSVYVRCTEPSDAAALKKHCIESSHLSHLPSFQDHAKELYQFLRGCDITGFNIKNFDTRVLTAEFRRARITWQPLHSTVDTMSLYNNIYGKQGSLQDAHKEFVGEYFAGAHNAEVDTIATLRLLYAMVAKEELRVAVEHILRPPRPPGRPLGHTQSSPALLGGRT